MTVEKIKALRARTGAGVMDCRSVLAECGGDVDAAEKLMRGRRSAKIEVGLEDMRAGAVHSYVHTGDRVGVMVEVACGTDFAARTSEFKAFAHDLAMHIAAMAPLWVSPAEAPWDSGGDGIDDSRYLLTQPFIKDGSVTIGDLVAELSDRIGEPVAIRRFVRWEVGEGVPEPEPQPLAKPNSPKVAGAVLLLAAIAAALVAMLCATC
jgi:elongation factor Ts